MITKPLDHLRMQLFEALVGRRVERDDGGEVDVAQEHVEQEEHQRGEVLEPAPPPHMLQDVVEIFNWLRGSFVQSSIGSHADLFAQLQFLSQSPISKNTGNGASLSLDYLKVSRTNKYANIQHYYLCTFKAWLTVNPSRARRPEDQVLL